MCVDKEAINDNIAKEPKGTLFKPNKWGKEISFA
jgi:hypothetical protein